MQPTDSKFQKILHFILFLSLSLQANSQSWSDKDEDESYVARHELGFVQAGDRFILFGGRESAQVLDVYDYVANSWSNGGTAPVEFNHFQAILYEGFIWVIGAFKDNEWPENNADYIYMYNPVTEEWIQGMEIPDSRKRGAAGLTMYNDKFYVVCGNNLGHHGGFVPYFDEFDPENGIWTSLTNAPHARDHFQSVAYNDKLFAIGGRLSGGEGGIFAPMVPEVDVYDFTTESWSSLASTLDMPTPRAGYGIALFNDEIYTIGGEGIADYDNSNHQWDTVEAFDPNTNTWSTKDPLNHSRHGIQAIVSGGAIYVTGGSQGGVSMKNMEYYGTDSPTGSPLINSTFAADELIKSFTYADDDAGVQVNITLTNSMGDTGTYIDSVVLNGTNFSLGENYDNKFLKSNSDLIIQVDLIDPLVAESDGTVTITYNNNNQIVVTLDGEQDNTLSTQDILEKSSTKLIPNPATDSFFFNSQVHDVTIYDMTGKKVIDYKGSFPNNHSFNINNLKKGIYFVKSLNDAGNISVLKLAKK